MLATSELQTKLDHLDLARLLRRRVAGEPFPHTFIHEADVYSAPPGDLVNGLEHGPGTDLGDGKGIAWYFCSPINFHESTDGRSTLRRSRQVVGGRGNRWHPEAGKKLILGPNKKPVAYTRTLSYVSKIKNPPGSVKRFTVNRLGWCMVEIGVEQQHGGADQLELCKVYMSPRTIGSGSFDLPATSEGGAVTDKLLFLPGGGDLQAPSSTSSDYSLRSTKVNRKPALSVSTGSTPSYGTSRLAIVKVAARLRDGGKAVVMKFGRSFVPSAEPMKEMTILTEASSSAVEDLCQGGPIDEGVCLDNGSLDEVWRALENMPAKRMKEMAKLLLSYPAADGQIVAVVLSEIENTTNNIFQVKRKALTCTNQNVSEIYEFGIIKQLYFRTIDELGLDRSIVSGPLDELEHHLRHIAMTKELTARTRDYLLFFGERTSTKIFFEHLNKLGKGTLQEWELCDVTSMGRSGSYLTAITVARAMGSTEIQAWKDVDGVLTCDPKIYEKAILVPYLTFDEGAELVYFCEQSRQLAMEGAISIIVKNSCNPQALGTVITKTRDMSKSILTSIVLKSNITMLDMQMISMLGHSAFAAKVFSICTSLEYLGTSVDCVVASEGKMLLALVPSKLLSQESIQLDVDIVVGELNKIAAVDILQHRSVISLIGNAEMSAAILELALTVLRDINVEVQKVSQNQKVIVHKQVVKVSLFVNDCEAHDCVKALHDAFFEKVFVPEGEGSENECFVPEIPMQAYPVPEILILESSIPENLSVAGSRFKRKATEAAAAA